MMNIEGNRSGAKRPYIGILFRCCRVYRRVYLNPRGTRFEGHCPRCGIACSVIVSGKGRNAQFWSAG